jgi:hypothetical protein
VSLKKRGKKRRGEKRGKERRKACTCNALNIPYTKLYLSAKK